MNLLKASGDGSPGFASSAAAGLIGFAPTSSGASYARCGPPLVHAGALSQSQSGPTCPGRRTHTEFSIPALGSSLGLPCCGGSIVLLLQHRFNYVSRGSLVCIERQMASSGCYLCYCRFLAVLSSCSLALLSDNTMSTNNGPTLCAPLAPCFAGQHHELACPRVADGCIVRPRDAQDARPIVGVQPQDTVDLRGETLHWVGEPCW